MLYKINKNKITEKILEEAIEVLNNGGVIIYPTDTAYALGCDAFNGEAVKKIFKIKERDENKSLPVIATDLRMAEKFFIFSKKEKELAKKFWADTSPKTAGRPLPAMSGTSPRGTGCKKKIIDARSGKLSIVLKVKKNTPIAKMAMAKDGTVAARVSNSLWPQKLSLAIGNPIISTSANMAGTGSCYSVGEIKKTGVEYKNIDLVLDAGKLLRVTPSTIVRVKKGNVEILREGSVEILYFK